VREVAYVAIAFAVAALPPPLFLTALTVATDADARRDPFAILALMGAFYSLTLFFAVVFGGIPFVVLRSFNFVRWWLATAAGLVVGLGVASTFGGSTDWQFVSVLGSSGAVSGLTFWAVWRKGANVANLAAPR